MSRALKPPPGEAPVDLHEDAQSEVCRERCHCVCEPPTPRATVPVPDRWGFVESPPPL